ncbi:tether containing UBX domain for GLUT4-like isoform X2 [Uloborus diversus]|uniref:tether containing UBX domain for GLUT4-like isoform X2 n=1 Tax=Uloborus diversus TaxID=327109 RepID=UPI0024094CC2|nr:tether containing UBX domain for GLUT4-like isoform X2 [Uloborus diversus]
MSQSFNFVVLCPNGRRQPVKVSPNSCILQILEEACVKQKINPDDFDICHYNKPLDLSLPVRFASLPNNGQLELRAAKKIRTESLVTIGLQLETGERIMKDFAPSSTVWQVLEQCSEQRSDVLSLKNFGQPVCVYMRQKLTGEDLKSTTLRSLGLTRGTAILRLMHRKADELEGQAHVSAPLSKPVPEKLLNTLETQSTSQTLCHDSPVPENTSTEQKTAFEKSVQCEKETLLNAINRSEKEDFPGSATTDVFVLNPTDGKEMTNCDSTEIPTKMSSPEVSLRNELEEDMDINESTVDETCPKFDISERHCILYSLNDITETKKADLPDEFFELTINDVKYLMEEYKKARNEMENQPLLTRQQRERQFLQKLSYYRETVIRIYFPEKLVLQAIFMSIETVQHVLDFVRTFLDDDQLDFYLYITPPKQKLPSTKTLLEAMLIPAAVVYFGCDSYRPNYLQAGLTEKISDPRAASFAAAESRKQSLTSTPLHNIVDIEEKNENVIPSTSSAEAPVKLQNSGKLPKWIKLSKQ